MRIQLNRIMQRCLAALAAGVIAISTFVGSGMTTEAAGGTGTLTITARYNGKVLSASDYDGTFKVYQVATYDAGGTFTAADEFHFADYEELLTSDYLSDSERFKEVTGVVTEWVNKNSGIEPVLSGVKAGASNALSYGLYLIAQDASASGYDDTTPFLVMIPSYSDGKTETNVTAYPKISKSSTPDEPHKPHEPGTPTTSVKYGKVALGKSDSVTGQPLQGVVFNLYKQDGDQWILTKANCVTDEKGVVYVDHLSYGNYCFIEAQTLDGYILDETPQTFTINAEDTVMLTMTNTPEDVPVEEGEPPTHGFTGDESNMILYGVVAGAAVIALVGWVVWQRKNERG